MKNPEKVLLANLLDNLPDSRPMLLRMLRESEGKLHRTMLKLTEARAKLSPDDVTDDTLIYELAIAPYVAHILAKKRCATVLDALNLIADYHPLKVPGLGPKSQQSILQATAYTGRRHVRILQICRTQIIERRNNFFRNLAYERRLRSYVCKRRIHELDALISEMEEPTPPVSV